MYHPTSRCFPSFDLMWIQMLARRLTLCNRLLWQRLIVLGIKGKVGGGCRRKYLEGCGNLGFPRCFSPDNKTEWSCEEARSDCHHFSYYLICLISLNILFRYISISSYINLSSSIIAFFFSSTFFLAFVNKSCLPWRPVWSDRLVPNK